MADSPETIASAVARRRASRPLLLLLDFDGTLAEFNPDPAAVHLQEPRRDLLARLARCRDVTVGIVSGRRLADLRPRIGDLGDAILAGFHGLEIEGPFGAFTHPDAAAAAASMRDIAAQSAPALRRMPGVFIEDKGLSIALHFRDAEPAHRVAAQSAFMTAAQPGIAAGRLRVLPGSCVVELLPGTSWNKGSALGWIRDRMTEAHGPVFTVYVGDDVTDRDAFAAIGEHGAGVAASDRVTATYRVDGPAEVERFLAALAAALDCQDA
jgi:trehalose 6-phosphate phosphatase